MPKPFRNTFKAKQSNPHRQSPGGTWALSKYEFEKRRWDDQNPAATSTERDHAMAAIASKCGV